MLFYRIYHKDNVGHLEDAFDAGIIEHDAEFESIELAVKYLENNYHPDPDINPLYEFAILAMWA